MEKSNVSSALGIASLICGIIGFLTGFIIIGIFFDLAAIVVGIIAIISKKQKSGLGIAGTIVGTLSLGVMVCLIVAAGPLVQDFKVLYNFTQAVNYSVNEDTEEEDEADADEDADEEETSDDNESEASDDEESSSATTGENAPFGYTYEGSVDVSGLTLVEYSMGDPDSYGDNIHFFVVTNNTDQTIMITANGEACADDGASLDSDVDELTAIGSNSTSIIKNLFLGTSQYTDHYEYTLTIDEDPTYDSVIQDISYDYTQGEDCITVTGTNNGTLTAEFLEATALFFKDGELVGYGTVYLTDDDDELKPGATASGDIDYYNLEFDTVEIYLIGRCPK